jgi:hypothetical protein
VTISNPSINECQCGRFSDPRRGDHIWYCLACDQKVCNQCWENRKYSHKYGTEICQNCAEKEDEERDSV